MPHILNTVTPAELHSIIHRGDKDAAFDLLSLALADQSRPHLSVVAPVYNEKENLKEFMKRLVPVLSQLASDYEVLLVNDGSDEETSQLLIDIANENSFVTVIELSRNFGHQSAINTGLVHTRGEVVVVMDSDLQDPPEVLLEFWKQYATGYDVVYGTRKNRKENILKKFCYAAFYRVLKLLSSVDIPLDAGDFCLMKRAVVTELIALPERNRFIRGLRSWVGFRQIGVPYDRDARYGGKPKYTIRRLVHLALDGLVSFSYRPLRAISLLGFIVSISSFLLAAFYAFQKIRFGLTPPGFATIMVAIFFFSGAQLVTLGILGEYLGKVYEEVKRRPLSVIRRVYSKDRKI